MNNVFKMNGDVMTVAYIVPLNIVGCYSFLPRMGKKRKSFLGNYHIINVFFL